MVRVEVPSLDFAVETGLFAVFLGIVVLLALFEEAMRGVVVRYALGGFQRVRSGVWRVRLGAIA